MIYLLPFIAAFIGWLTNYIAVKMLFHPKKEINILGIKVQGIFPKRQMQFAQKLGTLVSNELISFKEIENKLNSPNTIQKVLPYIETHIDGFLNVKLKEEMPLLSMFISDSTLSGIKKSMISEIEIMFPMILQQLMQNAQNELNIEKLVIEKVNNFSSDKLETLLYAIMQKEFKFIELIGAVLGFLIGCLQILLTLL